MLDRVDLGLTDSEWIRLLDGVNDDSSLPNCCAVISELRSKVALIVRAGRHETLISYGVILKPAWEEANGSHEFNEEDFGPLLKLIKGLGLETDPEAHRKHRM